MLQSEKLLFIFATNFVFNTGAI